MSTYIKLIEVKCDRCGKDMPIIRGKEYSEYICYDCHSKPITEMREIKTKGGTHGL